MLEFAVLGLLQESPLHGYELRRQLSARFGTVRSFSFGSLYPTLNRMQSAGWIAADDTQAAGKLGTRRKVTYRITAEGKERFAELLGEGGPSAWADENFDVHVAFFGQTEASTRLRILEGRRGRMEEKREEREEVLRSTRSRMDDYTLALQQRGLDSVEREVRWLSELIDHERAGGAAKPRQTGSTTTGPTQQ